VRFPRNFPAAARLGELEVGASSLMRPPVSRDVAGAAAGQSSPTPLAAADALAAPRCFRVFAPYYLRETSVSTSSPAKPRR
jgi:hypothetical protein